MSQQRLRATFVKGPQLKYISHLDLALAWERALRRAGVPLAYSQGHNPQARLQLASGLPVGYTGAAEVMDIILSRPMPPGEFMARVRPALPEGLSVTDAEEVPLKGPSLQSALREAVYMTRVETSLQADELTKRIANLLAADQLVQQRTRKQRLENFDLRPLMKDVWLEAHGEHHIQLGMRLCAGQQGNVRPDAVLAALGLADAYVQVERIRLMFEFDSL